MTLLSDSTRRRLGKRADASSLITLVLAVLGAVAVALGAVLVLRPFASLDALVWWIAATMLVTGVADLVPAGRSASPVLTRVVGLAWILAAVVVLAWAGLTLRALAVVAGVVLAVGGIGRVAAGLHGTTDERLSAVLRGVAELVLGVLALVWPDLTLLAIAVIFGVRIVLTGLALLGDAWRVWRPREPDDAPLPVKGRRPWWRRSLRPAASVAALVLALALAAVSAKVHAGEPQLDAFYVPPRTVPSQPGRLLRTEPYSTAIPAGSVAWRILYTTTRDDGRAAVASGIVLRSATVPPGPRPVIAWAHGTTGFAENCAPSILGTGLDSGALPAADAIVSNGWVLVATDYVGLGSAGPHPYLIGQGEARSVLDAVRAARQLDGVSLSDRTVVWGHSQGGGAALWTGGVQAAYAPDVPLSGVVAIAPASDLPALVDNLAAVRGGSIFASFVAAAYTRTYPDVGLDDYITPAARTFVLQMSQRCLAEPEVLVSIGASLTFDRSIFARDPATGAFGRRLRENTPTAHIPAPLLIAQGGSDPLILPDRQAAYAKRLCAAGQHLEYRTYPGRDHVGVVSPGSAFIPYLVSWTQDRFAGKPFTPNCDGI